MPFCLESALGEFACKIKEQITLEVQIGDKRRKKAPSLGTGIHLELGAVKLITSGGGGRGREDGRIISVIFFFLVNLWQNFLSLVGHSPQPPIELLSGDELQHNRFL